MNNLNVLLLGVVVFVCGCIVAEICPPDWHRYNESCYFIIKDMVDWYEANRTCAESHANLAVPNSSSEQDYIWELFLDEFDRNSSTHLWIGCNDIEEEGQWRHCPLRGETDLYENWKDDQPNGLYDDLQDCAVMWNPSGRWHDRKCLQDIHAVCELPVRNIPMFCKQTGADDRLTPQCLLHHAMNEWEKGGKACRSHPRYHSFYLPKQN